MVNVACPIEGCNYETGDYPASIVAALLSAHTAGAHTTAPTTTRRPPKVDRPELSDGTDEEAWNTFVQSWTIFVKANHVEDDELAVQLYSCCRPSLKQKVTAVHPDFLDRGANDLLPLLKALTVIPIARTVKQNEFLHMKQDPSESIRTYFSKVKSKAITCRFKKVCSHPHAPLQPGGVVPNAIEVDYTNEMIRHVILSGLYDEEIRRDIFGNDRIDDMEVTELVTLIEGKETARDATNTDTSNSAISQYKRHQRGDNKQQKQPIQPLSHHDINKKGKCSCGVMYNVYARLRSGHYNKTPFTACKECWSRTHQRQPPPNTDVESAALYMDITTVDAPPSYDDTDTLPNSLLDTITSASNKPIAPPLKTNNTIADVTQNLLPEVSSFHAGRFVLKHHIFRSGEWKSDLAQPHPTVNVCINTNDDDYDKFHIKTPPYVSFNVEAVVDSGAQCCLWGWSECKQAGFRRKDLISVTQKLNGVSNSKLSIYGALLLRFTGTSTSGDQFNAAAVVYISPDVKRFYMSQDVMIQLRIVPPSFPSIGSANLLEVSANSNVSNSCPCLPRSKSLGRIEQLPFAATEENIPAMKNYLLDRYKNNVFNQCIHQRIPKMTGPPMRIHVDPEAEGTVITKQGKCPLHWEDKVNDKFTQDISMGVIEPFPAGKPPKWIHRAHYVRKPDGYV